MPKTYRAIFDGQTVRPLEPIDLPAASEVLVSAVPPEAPKLHFKPDLQALNRLAGMLYDPKRRTVTIEEMEEAGPVDPGQAFT